MPVLDAVYPDYFGQVPEEIRKGSTKVKAIFKGQYQIYPPIKTLTLKNFKPIDYNVKFFLVTYSYASRTITLTFSHPQCPTFYFNYAVQNYIQTSTYDGYYETNYYSEKITLTSSVQTSISFPTFSYDKMLNYGIATISSDRTYQKKITFMSGSTRIVISLEANQLYANDDKNGYSIYTWDVDEYTSSTALNGSMESFKVYKETSRSNTGSSTGGTAEFIPTQSSTGNADIAYVKSGKLYLYSSYLPTVPYNGFTIEGFGSTPMTLANCGAYTMSYFYQLPAPILPDYYANLTGNKNTVNLFDYNQTSKITTYRYNISEQVLPSYIFKANLTQNYEWNYEGSTLSVSISRTGDPFYVLDFYVSTVKDVYVELAKQRGANYGVEYEKGAVGLTAGNPVVRSVDFTHTWNLTDKTSKASQYGATRVNSNYPTTSVYNYSSTKFTSATRSYTLNLYSTSSIITSSSQSTPVKAGAGIDWFSTWWWAHGGSTTTQPLSTYLNNTYKTLTASTTCTLYVFALGWQGFIDKAYHVISFRYVGQLTLKTRVNNNAIGLQWTY